MTTTSAPFGLNPVYHPSGTIRQDVLNNGVASTYGTALYTGTPVKRASDGTLVAVGTGADVAIGIFQGCEYTDASGRFIVSPYWPASATYADDGLMQAYFTSDPGIIYEAQANGAVTLTENGASINLADASQGSTYTGRSTQSLDATTTGASAGTFQVVNLAPYTNNSWGDAYTIVQVKISSYQGPVA
jgi:hypothetical protein